MQHEEQHCQDVHRCCCKDNSKLRTLKETTQEPVKIVSKKPTRSVHRIDESTFSDGEYSMYKTSYSGRPKCIFEPYLRNGERSAWTDVTVQFGSGSEANCLRLKDVLKIENRPPLKKTHVVLKAYKLWRRCDS